MKWFAPFLLLCLPAASTAEHLPAPQDVTFAGQVSVVRDSDALLAGSVQLGDSVDGIFQLVLPRSGEKSTLTLDALNPPTLERIDYGSRCGELRVDVGSSIAMGTHGIDIDTTDFPSGQGTDRYNVRGSGFAPRADPELPFDVQVEFALQDAAGDAATLGQALPLPGDLASWDSGALTIVGCAFGTRVCTDSSPRFEIEATLQSFSTDRSDTCLVSDLLAFDGEVHFDKLKSVLTNDTTATSVDSVLFRSDGSMRLRIDAMTELAGQFTGGKLSHKHTRRRYEVAAESEGALLAYIESKVLELGGTLVAEPGGKPATLEWTQPHSTPEASLELRAHFRFDDPDGKNRKGVLILDVMQPTPALL